MNPIARRTVLAVAAALLATAANAKDFLNVSYDPTREFYKDVNSVFAADWKAKTSSPATAAPASRPAP